MNPRLIVVSIAVVVVVGAGAAALNGTKPNKAGNQNAPRPQSSTLSLLEKINANREQNGKNLLARDSSLETWLQGQLTSRTPEQIAHLKAEDLLQRFENALPAVKTFSAGVYYGRNEDDIREQVLQWADIRNSMHTHMVAASVPITLRNANLVTVVILAARVADFSPDLLGSKSVDFLQRCPICKHEYLGRYLGDQITLAIRCPKCQELHGLVAFGTDGKFRHVNAYLNGLQPMAKFPPNITRLEELCLIWRSVVERSKYASDGPPRDNSSPDAWQESRRTLELGKGDCEDISILLTDWLISRGFDARVVIGKSRSLAGHAWCVANLDGMEYLLETTDPSRLKRLPPVAEDCANDYTPEVQFDREALYTLRSNGVKTCAYWSELIWRRVPLPTTAPPKTTELRPEFPAALGHARQ